jgi:addiction module HigA family antidote
MVVTMGRMHNPPHPGESIREDILPALGITVTEAAGQLGVARVTLSRLINGQAGISADMARRLEAWLAARRKVQVLRVGSICRPITICGRRCSSQHRKSSERKAVAS